MLDRVPSLKAPFNISHSIDRMSNLNALYRALEQYPTVGDTHCRGPEQIVSGRSDGKSAGAPVSEAGRAMLADLMQEGLGDHVLLLRIYEVN